VLRHRGPDDEGHWCDAAAGIAFGHRRLSIIDLSPAGHQPMMSCDGRYVIVFNGEIYNFQELRSELTSAGARFRGHSDTEVMLAAIAHWGLEPAVRRFAGMFAFALFDRHEHIVHLCRDRLGEKPLYYGRMGQTVLFGSELKALRAHPDWPGRVEIDRGALQLLLRFGYIASPHTIYRGIHKVQPGTLVSITRDPDQAPTAAPFWSATEASERGRREPLAETVPEMLDQLDGLLRTTIRREMVSDVPLGAFLSGGIDSSLIVALMQRQSSRPVRTFTIGFNEREYDEARYAGAVARHLGTEHTEFYVTPQEAQAVVLRLPEMFDEPLGDPSQVPTYLLSALARRHVTVSLTGDGGDELFGGYDRHGQVLKLWSWLRWVPAPMRHLTRAGISAVPAGYWDQVLRPFGGALSRQVNARVTGDRLHKLAQVIGMESPQAMFFRLLTHWPSGSVVLGGTEYVTATSSSHPTVVGDANLLDTMTTIDMSTYLPDSVLVKADRTSMAVSLESRAPFLDHNVVEFAKRIPAGYKLRDGKGKWLLRQLLNRYVPEQLVDRPKQGFGIPIDHWLRGPLKDWAGSLLQETRLRNEGYLDAKAIATKWREHLSGTRNWQALLWDVLMFEAWLEAQR
jgi:asparagine synthase (glutamine-hydrolysing)